MQTIGIKTTDEPKLADAFQTVALALFSSFPPPNSPSPNSLMPTKAIIGTKISVANSRLKLMAAAKYFFSPLLTFFSALS